MLGIVVEIDLFLYLLHPVLQLIHLRPVTATLASSLLSLVSLGCLAATLRLGIEVRASKMSGGVVVGSVLLLLNTSFASCERYNRLGMVGV